MKKVLVTGATGNIGSAIIKHLCTLPEELGVTAGVRNIQKAQSQFKDFSDLKYLQFDFEDSSTFENSLHGFDTVFLLRPPHLSKVDPFVPLIESIKKAGIQELVFLSVQGADKSKVIPHNKIERLIKKYGVPYIFVRPSYFMQNLTTTLYREIKDERSITLPAGKAKFNWVDIEDIAASTAQLILNFSHYKNQALDITGNENMSFGTVVQRINKQVDRKLKYNSVGPIRFYRLKRREGVEKGLVMVMLVLHYLPRFQKEPMILDYVKKLTGKEPISIEQFIQREKILLA